MSNNKKPNLPFDGKFTGLLFILVVIVAVIFLVHGCTTFEKVEVPESTTPVLSESPDLEESQKPEKTEPPVPSPSESLAPSPTPSETAKPTPTPTPAPVATASGSFTSDTGTALNAVLDWTASDAGDGKVLVTVKLSVNSYSLHVNAMPGGALIEIGDKTFSLKSAEVKCDSTSEIVKTELATAQLTMPLNSDGTLSIPITATWNFKGTYSDKEFESVGVAGLATIS